MKKLILVCGPAGIGKSTYTRRYKESHPDENVFVISADDTRCALCGGYDKFPPTGNMLIVYDAMIEKAKKLVETEPNLTIIMDTTSLTDRRRLHYSNALRKDFDRLEIKLLRLHDYQLCYKRNSTRAKDRFVPEHVITDMIAHYEDPGEEVKKVFDDIEEVYMDQD